MIALVFFRLPTQSLTTKSLAAFVALVASMAVFLLWSYFAKDSAESMQSWRELQFERHGSLSSSRELIAEGACDSMAGSVQLFHPNELPFAKRVQEV